MILKNKEKLKRFAHFLAGGIILLHAYERHETGHGPYLFFAVAGLIFLTLAIFHHKLEKKFRGIDSVFFVIEGVLSLLIAYDYFHMGKKLLPFTYLFAGALQIVMAIVKYRKGVKSTSH